MDGYEYKCETGKRGREKEKSNQENGELNYRLYLIN